MTNPLKAAGQSVVEIIRSAELSDNSSEYAEMVIDSMLADGLLKDIPVVNTALAIGRLAFGIRDHLLMRKLARFLGEIACVSPENRRAMVSKLEADPCYSVKVGEHIIELLNRAESARKPEMIARVFAAYADQRIDRPMMFRLLTAIERLPLAELSLVRTFQSDTRAGSRAAVVDAYTEQIFANAGLATISSPIGGLSFHPNEVCRTFIQLDIDRAGQNAD